MYPEYVSKDLLEDPELEVDAESHQALETVAKWSRFISITMFVFCTLAFLIFLIGGITALQNLSRYSSTFRMAGASGGAVLILMLVAVVIITLWYNFLYKFSVRLREALFSQEPQLLASAFNSLRVHLIFSIVISALGILSSLLTLSSFSRYNF
jgi:magnesium-transporting ATPase (P-type)